MPILTQPFNTYRIEYGITNPNGADISRIEFLLNDKKIGQALFGNAITPGSFAALINNDEIHLYFPLSHFHNIILLLRTVSELQLFVEIDEVPDRSVSRGGIMARA